MTKEQVLEGWLKDLDEFLKTYDGNKQDFCNGVRWFASRDYNSIVERALEKMLADEEKALANLEEDMSTKAEFQALCEWLDGWRGISWQNKTEVAEAIMQEKAYISLKAAKALSCLYCRIPIQTIKDALLNGEIEGKIPIMETVEYKRWHGNTSSQETRKQPVGKYAISVKSLVIWLEARYSRGFGKISLAYKYIDKIVKG